MTHYQLPTSNNIRQLIGNDAVEFFQNSRLPEAELAQIWDLADTQQRGKLSRDEFAVAMHLIHKRLGGQPIPRQLPATLVPPSSRSGKSNFAERHTMLWFDSLQITRTAFFFYILYSFTAYTTIF
jgi:hypothetical protein